MKTWLISVLLAFGLSQGAVAQTTFPTPSGQGASGIVNMCLDASNKAVPVSNGTCANGGGSAGSVTQGTTPWVDNITQWGSVSVAAASAYGTAPSGNVPGVNAYVTNTVSDNISQWGGASLGAGTAFGTTPTGNVGSSNSAIFLYNGTSYTSARDVAGAGAGSSGVAAVSQIPTSSANTAIIPVVSNGPASSLVGKASAGNRYAVRATNLTSTAGFLVGYNATAAPADGALTGTLVLECYPLPANGLASAGGIIPKRYSTGITWIVTSAATCYTKTTGVITAAIQTEVE